MFKFAVENKIYYRIKNLNLKKKNYMEQTISYNLCCQKFNWSTFQCVFDKQNVFLALCLFQWLDYL